MILRAVLGFLTGVAACSTAFMAMAQPASAAHGEAWSAPGPGIVLIKPDGRYTIDVDDLEARTFIVSYGIVTSQEPTLAGGRSYSLKSQRPDQTGWSFQVISKSDRTADLYLKNAHGRHLVARLKK